MINAKNFWLWFGGIWLFYGLPIGQMSVQVTGQIKPVMIEETEVTEF